MAKKECGWIDSELISLVEDEVLLHIVKAYSPTCVEDLGPRVMVRLHPKIYCEYLENLLVKNEETH